MSDTAIAAMGPLLFIIGCLIVGLPLLNADTTAGRFWPCLACILLIARTLVWRVSETLPPFTFSLIQHEKPAGAVLFNSNHHLG